jgi:hypothetical protein
VGSYRKQQDRLAALMLNELKNDAQVVSPAARPATCKITFQLVRTQASVEGVGFESLKCLLQLSSTSG